jgi:hypothetical protein
MTTSRHSPWMVVVEAGTNVINGSQARFERGNAILNALVVNGGNLGAVVWSGFAREQSSR